MKKIKYTFIALFALSLISACSVDCSNSVGQYEDGYYSGKLLRTVGTSASCSKWAQEMGMSSPTDCFCDGFSDGKSGKENKYEK